MHGTPRSTRARLLEADKFHKLSFTPHSFHSFYTSTPRTSIHTDFPVHFQRHAKMANFPWHQIQNLSRDCSAFVTPTIDRLAASIARPVAASDDASCFKHSSKKDASKVLGSKKLEANKLAPKVQQKRRVVDLKSLNPSLSVIGAETISALMPRFLPKAGLACERMQHLGMTPEMIRMVLRAVWSIPPDGEEKQSEEALREIFSMLDTSGDGVLDMDEFLAMLQIIGETLPAAVLPRLFALVDNDRGGTVDGAEFVQFVRRANPYDEGSPEGWMAFLPESAAHFEEIVLLHVSEGRSVGERGRSSGGKAWRVIGLDELEHVTRSAAEPWSTSIVLPRTDVENAEAVIRGLRALKFRDDEIHTVVRTLFVSHTDADYAKLFRIFDQDNDGGIDPYEFREICSLFGDHATEAEARELFVGADEDNDGTLNVAEFTQLIKRITPKAQVR